MIIHVNTGETAKGTRRILSRSIHRLRYSC